MASLDPLGLEVRKVPIELDPALYGFSEADLDRQFFLGTWQMKGFLSEDNPVQTLRQILNRLRDAYCGNIGYEYMHISDRDQCNWLREKIEQQELAVKQINQTLKEDNQALKKLQGEIDKERSSGKSVWETVGISTIQYKDPFHTGLSKRTPTGGYFTS